MKGTDKFRIYALLSLSFRFSQIVSVIAFQNCLSSRYSLSECGIIRKTRIPIILSTYHVERSTPKISSKLNDNVNENEYESLFGRMKSHIESYQEDDKINNTNATIFRKLEPYIKYPIRRIRNYFQRIKQRQLYSMNDVIVSDETVYDIESENYEIQESPSYNGTEKIMNNSTEESLPGTKRVDNNSNKVIDDTSSISRTSPQIENYTNRSDISVLGIDLSGNWTIVIVDDFKKKYDKYLALLGQPYIVRSIALSIIGMTTEETKQSNNGSTLVIKGTNARGVWERTLFASNEENPLMTPVLTVDSEKVAAEAWWNGPFHQSWLRGVTKYGGGDFESKRYLEDNGTIYVCETTFHPNDPKREKAQVTWRFKRLEEKINLNSTAA